MGLDNIPNRYPCVTAGTAVMTRLEGTDHEVISCRETQDHGGCPWLNAEPPHAGQVVGMLGTDCWYRGKYGNHLIEKWGEYNELEGYSFYGSNADGTHKTAAECLMLSEYMTGLLPTEEVGNPGPFGDEMDDEDQDGIRYAAWWLKFAAEHCDGSNCWY